MCKGQPAPQGRNGSIQSGEESRRSSKKSMSKTISMSSDEELGISVYHKPRGCTTNDLRIHDGF